MASAEAQTRYRRKQRAIIEAAQRGATVIDAQLIVREVDGRLSTWNLFDGWTSASEQSAHGA